MKNTIYKTLYQETHGFLARNTDNGYMKKQLEHPVYPMAETLEDIFRYLLDALIYTKGMKEIIGPVEALAQFVFGFNPIKTNAKYGDQWERMYAKIKPPSESLVPVEENNEEYWECFCMGALTGAGFLSQLGTVDKFKAFIKVFQNNDMAWAVLPLLLQKVVYGMGFPMACVFLNSVGYPDYVSPDPKVKSLLKDIGVTESMDNYEALKTLIMISQINQKPMAYVHKMFHLIGHGKLSDGNKDKRYRKEFIGHITPLINCLNYSHQT